MANVRLVCGGQTARRLAEIGFVPGATVEMLRRGDPCILRLERARLSLGEALQRDVLVTDQ
jgi:Fe2+ transport system protein FeoA